MKKCAAIFDDEASATTWNISPPVRVYGRQKQCDYRAVEGRYCRTHARLHDEGMVDDDKVKTANDRREIRDRRAREANQRRRWARRSA